MGKKAFEYTISELSTLIETKELSPVEVTTDFLNRIHMIDHKVNAFIEVLHEQAMKDAEVAEREIAEGRYRGKLHGIPIGLKDLVYTKGIRTTMGSPIYKDFIPEEDAFIVEKLKNSGAIIIGKLNTHQFAYGPTGDRSYFGPVKNPYDTSKMSGGSSSGSAAAVSTRMCLGAIGTDTSGSVRIPAAFCGIVGMKPTAGLVSKRGVYPLSSTLDHIGPMTKTVEDNALLLNAIAGYDFFDYSSRELHFYSNYDEGLKESIKGKIIGVPKNFYFENLDEEIETAVAASINTFKKLGAEIIELEVPNVSEMIEAQQVILRSEAYAVHKKHLENPENEWDEEVRERLYTGKGTPADVYIEAQQLRIRSIYQFKQLFEKMDAMISPTTAILPPDIEQREINKGIFKNQHIRWPILRLTGHINLIGFPALSVPCGISANHLPISVQLIGNMFNEGILYQLGEALVNELNIVNQLDKIISIK